MSEQEYFKKALSNFTYEIASGGAIRHLADQGYSIKQIQEHLDFPTSYEKIQKTVWEHLQHTGVLLLEEPGNGKQQENITFVKEYDNYGRPSFRRVVLSNSIEPTYWKETQFDESVNGSLAAYLKKKCKQNGTDTAYLSCDFGLRSSCEIESFRKVLQGLKENQLDYILGLPWEKKIFYHRANWNMIEIIAQLYENGEYAGNGYFLELKEKIKIAKNK